MKMEETKMTRNKLFNLDGKTIESWNKSLEQVIGEKLNGRKFVPIGRPLIVDTGCPADTHPMYHGGWGSEYLIHAELLGRKEAREAHAFSYSEGSFYSGDDPHRSFGRRDHRIYAVQLYKLV